MQYCVNGTVSNAEYIARLIPSRAHEPRKYSGDPL